MAIWNGHPSLEALNAMSRDTMVSAIGIEFTEIGDDFLRARMPVESRTRQPYGILHGGASAALAETLGSVASSLCVDPTRQVVAGLEINANHVRTVRDGFVVGVCRPIHLGRSTHVWDIRISDEADRLVCISRLTVAVLRNDGTSRS